jgi:hypothetical protein
MTHDVQSTATLPAEMAGTAPKPVKPSPMRAALQMLVGMLVGGVIGGVGMALAVPDISPETKAALRQSFGAFTAPMLVVLVLLVAYAGIVVHELGHVAGGLLARFRFYLFVAGPLRVERDPDTGRVRVGFNRVVGLAGGIAAMLPTGTHDLRRRFGYLIAGGPLASFALALVLWPVSRLVEGSAPIAGIVLTMAALISAALGVVTLIPMRSGGFTSDGGRLLRMLRGGPEAEREAATLPLLSLSYNETPPRQWPRELVEQAVAHQDGSGEECYANLLAYYHALDSGDLATAGRWLARTLELLPASPKAMHPGVHLEAAFFTAAHRRDAARAREHLAQVPPNAFGVREPDRHRAEAALALAEGDTARAGELAKKALSGFPARATFRRESLRAALASATEPGTATA